MLLSYYLSSKYHWCLLRGCNTYHELTLDFWGLDEWFDDHEDISSRMQFVLTNQSNVLEELYLFHREGNWIVDHTDNIPWWYNSMEIEYILLWIGLYLDGWACANDVCLFLTHLWPSWQQLARCLIVQRIQPLERLIQAIVNQISTQMELPNYLKKENWTINIWKITNIQILFILLND